MTPETTTVVAYLLWFVLGGVPQGTPFSVTTVPGLPSLEECQYLARELMPGIPDPKFRCIRYQTVTAAAPAESTAANEPPLPWTLYAVDDVPGLPKITGLHKTRGPYAGHFDNKEACEASGRIAMRNAIHPDFECVADAAPPDDYEDEDNSQPTPPPAPAPAAQGVPIPEPHTKIEREFGTIFGTMPRDGRAAPLNELVIATRSTFFRIFIWPDVARRFNAKMKELDRRSHS
jgi:hypothetical protein